MALATAAPLTTRLQPAGADARPIIPRNDTNLWTRAERLRDELYARFEKECAAISINPLLLASSPSEFPAWVKFEAWQRQDDSATTERSSVQILFEPKPYHTHEFELEVRLAARNREWTIKRVEPLTSDDVKGLLAFLVQGGKKPRLRRFRETPLQLWRTKNKIEGLGPDWFGLGFAALVLVAMGTLNTVPIFSVGAVVAAVYLFLVMRKRRWIVRIDGKPDTEPRNLWRMDSWQAVVFNLGNDVETVRQRFVNALGSAIGPHQKFRSERVWYWGLDGKEERDQYVLTAGRGIVFCQVYSYGEDLYVGWVGHLNLGQWFEQTVRTGIDKKTGNPITIKRVVPGWQTNSDYDTTDLSCLMEWTHAQVTKVLKQLLAEKHIDQEIDFKIQRGERRGSGTADAKKGKEESNNKKLFARTG